MHVGLISWIIPAEVFPLRARGKASAISTLMHGLSSILASYFIDIWLRSNLSTAGCFIIFAALCSVFGVFILVALPETKGIMLEGENLP